MPHATVHCVRMTKWHNYFKPLLTFTTSLAHGELHFVLNDPTGLSKTLELHATSKGAFIVVDVVGQSVIDTVDNAELVHAQCVFTPRHHPFGNLRNEQGCVVGRSGRREWI